MGTTPEDVAKDEFIEEVIEEHREEIRDEILAELGEEYVVWVDVSPPDVQNLIADVARSITNLLSAVKGDNELPERTDLLSEIERAQIIAILEATLVELQAPAIDRGRIEGISRGLRKFATRAGEKGASKYLEDKVEGALNSVVRLFSRLLEESPVDTWFS